MFLAQGMIGAMQGAFDITNYNIHPVKGFHLHVFMATTGDNLLMKEAGSGHTPKTMAAV